MKKPPFVVGEIYHIYNRGVEKRNIFNNDKDRIRFINSLLEFNTTHPVTNLSYRLKNSIEVGLRYELIEILAFCLMPNHYHLLIKQRGDKGIPKFMQKLGTGYTKFFNLKYERVGPLFQGKFKAVLVKRYEYFKYLPYYIHLNPLELVMPDWKEKGIRNYKEAMAFLENYRWSSFQDYLGKKNFPEVTQRDFLIEILGHPKEHQKDFLEYLKDAKLDSISELTLE